MEQVKNYERRHIPAQSCIDIKLMLVLDLQVIGMLQISLEHPWCKISLNHIYIKVDNKIYTIQENALREILWAQCQWGNLT